MIVAFSTSSPWASVALIAPDGAVLAEAAREAIMAASGACMSMLDELLSKHSLSLAQATGFVADLGPGSFAGVRVGVTMAKTLAYATSQKCAGLSSFDLIDPAAKVVVPSRKGEFFVREPGKEPTRIAELPTAGWHGYGPVIAKPTYPNAAAFGRGLARLNWIRPEELVPLYLIEPSISVPKRPYAEGAVG